MIYNKKISTMLFVAASLAVPQVDGLSTLSLTKFGASCEVHDVAKTLVTDWIQLMPECGMPVEDLRTICKNLTAIKGCAVPALEQMNEERLYTWIYENREWTEESIKECGVCMLLNYGLRGNDYYANLHGFNSRSASTRTSVCTGPFECPDSLDEIRADIARRLGLDVKAMPLNQLRCVATVLGQIVKTTHLGRRSCTWKKLLKWFRTNWDSVLPFLAGVVIRDDTKDGEPV
jgi:hypothetical protein